ncbi:hypothetical protein [Lewinella sp. 4G2]|uniref:hypothetical protein n=1 Tax=Lewinella sp. 4G2 TaxID=1803372 RepID=UPI0007B46012|nr:hypothetical protein [Lewinella sp. 4G2]OAV44450.1 hypothetical protein A3850_008090 [Lewinella sp. 4G2]
MILDAKSKPPSRFNWKRYCTPLFIVTVLCVLCGVLQVLQTLWSASVDPYGITPVLVAILFAVAAVTYCVDRFLVQSLSLGKVWFVEVGVIAFGAIVVGM